MNGGGGGGGSATIIDTPVNITTPLMDLVEVVAVALVADVV